MAGAQIGVLRGKPLNPFAFYITEILESLGFSSEWAEEDFDGDLLVIPRIEAEESVLDSVRERIKRGKAVLALRPDTKLGELLGLRTEGGYTFCWTDRYAWLEDEGCLQYHGPAELYEAEAGVEVSGWLLWEPGAPPSEYPAVVRAEGSGRTVAFTFDLAQCAVLFRQGRMEQAGNGTNPDPDADRMFKPNDLFVNYLDPRLKDIPQLDIWLDFLAREIEWLVEPAVIPRVWYFPDGQRMVGLMNGDSDGCSAKGLRFAFDFCEKKGARYTLFLMEEQFGSLPPEAVVELRVRGHDVSLHPWLCPKPRVEEFQKYLREAFGRFAERYAYVPSAVRHHSAIIAGWTETQEALAEIGINLDFNWFAGRFFQCGFVSGSGRAMRFCRRDGRVLNIFQQATLVADDAMLEAKTLFPAMSLDGALRYTEKLLDTLSERHGVFNPCFHPIYISEAGTKTLDWLGGVIDYLGERGVRCLSARDWAEFNLARRSVRIERMEVEGEESVYRIGSERAVRGLTILFPESVSKVSIGEEEVPLIRGRLEGKWRNYIVFDKGAGDKLSLGVR